MFWLLTAAALAQPPTPYQCSAVWIGPRGLCDLPGTWSAVGTGKDEEKARENALLRVEKAVEAKILAAEQKTAGTVASAVVAQLKISCEETVASGIHFTCEPISTLAEKRLCYVDLSSRQCWTGEIQNVEGTVYKVMESGRKKMCKQVHAYMSDVKYTEEQRQECMATCYQEARVRCPEAP